MATGLISSHSKLVEKQLFFSFLFTACPICHLEFKGESLTSSERDLCWIKRRAAEGSFA